MDKPTIITMVGIAALAIYASMKGLPAMFVSAVTIAVAVRLFRHARMRDRLIAIVAAGLGGGIASEIGYSIYRHAAATGSAAAANGGEMFMTAMLLGLSNAAAVIGLVLLIEVCLKYRNRNSA